MIAEENVDQIRETADIVSIIGEYVPLKRSGNSFRGPCPFHHGTHNNFSVSPRGGFACFVCGEKGDVFTFLQKHLGLDFVGAVRLVAEKAGIEVRETKSRRPEEKDPREPFWEANAAAAEFFQKQLNESTAGRAAREYLESRGISLDDAKRFGIGFAPRGEGLWKHLTTLGYSDRLQVAAGLAMVGEGKEKLRSRFRDRLMFPIYDVSGRCVGFGGRLMGPGEPKYLNSSDSEVFSKRSLLYGLNWAKNAIRKNERVFVVEGYFDVIRLALAGVEEAVAPMGTALTEKQAGLIRKYTRNAYLLYDSDQAGLKATFRSGDMLLAAGVSGQVVTLPNGEDPDTFAAKHGRQGLEREIGQSIDVFDRKVQILERAGYFADVRKRREALDKLLPTIRVTEDRLLADLYVSRAAEVCGVSRELLRRELDEVPPQSTRIQPAPVTEPRRDGEWDEEPERPSVPGRYMPAERELVRILVHQRQYIEEVAERLGDEGGFIDADYGRIFDELVADPEVTVGDLLERTEDSAITVQLLLSESGALERAEQGITNCVFQLRFRQRDIRLLEIDFEMQGASPEKQDELLQEKTRIVKGEMIPMKIQRWKGFNSPKNKPKRKKP